MAEYCPFCGAVLTKADAFCTQCGKPASREPVAFAEPITLREDLSKDEGSAVPDAQSPGKKRSRVKWWMILIAVVVAAAALLMLCWSRISLYLMPEIKLANAFAHTSADLTERLDGSPLSIFGKIGRWQNGYTTEMEMELSIGMFGGMSMNITSAYDPANGATVTISDLNTLGDHSLTATYSNPDCVVFALEAAGDRLYYGIDLATFEEDLRGSSAFAGVDQQTMDAFIAAVDAVSPREVSADREALNRRYTQAFLDILKSSAREAGYENYPVDGVSANCSAISYTLDNEQLADGLETLAEIADEDDLLRSATNHQTSFSSLGLAQKEDVVTAGDIPSALRMTAEKLRGDDTAGLTIGFWIYEDRLVGIALKADAEGKTEYELHISLGANVATGDILVTARTEAGTDTYLLSLDRGEDTYSETLTITKDGETHALRYAWNSDTGELEIHVDADGQETEISAELLSGDDSITLVLPDILDLVDPEGSGGMEFLLTLARLDATVTIREGAEVEIPAYKSLDQWTEDDLDIVLNYFLG